MQVSPYLIFNGNCGEAFPFYERVLGGRLVVMQRHQDTPVSDCAGAEWQHNVIHASLEISGFSLMGSDAPPGDERPPGRRLLVALRAPAADAERIFHALADGGRVTMPFENTFWSPGFGMLVDRFGIPWLVNTDPAS